MAGPRKLAASAALLLGSLLVMAGRADAFDLNGAWASAADQCAKVFTRQGGRLGFAEMSDVYGGGFDIEIITPELQKIQFASSGQMKLGRPDKLRIRRTGGYADVELVYDGKAISVYGNNAKSYVQADAPGTVDQLIDAIQARS